MKKAIFSGLLLFSLVIVSAVFASQDGKVYWCHCEPNGNCQTLHLPLQALQNAGHVSAQGNPLHAGDHAGSCTNPTNTPTPTPTVTTGPTATPTVAITPTVEITPTPTIIECDGECITPTPTDEPRVTPTPTKEPEIGLTGASAPTVGVDPGPHCDATPPVKTVANFHLYRKGPDAILKWVPTEGGRANVYYKQVNSDTWQYSLRDVQNTGYVEIHDLGSLDITFAVQLTTLNPCYYMILT
jgi:hypothetical protein